MNNPIMTSVPTEGVATPRFLGVAIAVACWSVVWVLLLNIVPAGSRGRNHIITLNATHGVVSTISSAFTLYYGLDTTISVAVSLSYFLVDLAVMIHLDGIRNLYSLRRSRLMDYGHHVFGLYWGVVLFMKEATVCEHSFGNAYVWMQTNEVSTFFYNWFRLTDSTVAGALFASSFFLSRVLFNTIYIIPKVATKCKPLYVLGCMPYFVLQYVWFYMIARKILMAAPQQDQTGKGNTLIADGNRATTDSKKDS
ncbi:uncharacterized protein PHALS_05321 [Plasmopara halstedii]|uniref:TLC domain-containing protein n=1 Tax=Plasmopara halstedii TaxID=4781 RepID=A0A0P1A9Y0_PLAHL|nr:uncharacterized protein PHALS_05321 [Plasmopara halstedii]CEG37541.1 hypothetical protein PHALS_05321 [Plasmopara halstedii]|eukprot:XP_024573910.1 hypothetical protein PHALS_05321 [Plasmopara halstedii]